MKKLSLVKTTLMVCLSALALNIYTSYRNLDGVFAYREDWKLTRPLPTNIRPLLNKKYYYLAQGAQMIAFVSEDGKTVLKFTKQHHLRLPWWEAPFINLPGLEEYKKKRYAKKERKTKKLLRGIALAWDQASEETGLLYVHMEPTDTLNIKTNVVDRFGITHTFNMDGREFILQKRAYPISSKDEALPVQQRLAEKGLKDGDKFRLENYGNTDEGVILIDFGELTVDR